MASWNKTCEDCGSFYTSRRKNAKRCSLCRTIRDLMFVEGWTTECWICDKTIAPMQRGDQTCGDPDHTYEPKKYGTQACSICKKERPRVRGDVNVCSQCAHDVDLRPKLLRSLLKKQKERRMNPVLEPVLEI